MHRGYLSHRIIARPLPKPFVGTFSRTFCSKPTGQAISTEALNGAPTSRGEEADAEFAVLPAPPENPIFPSIKRNDPGLRPWIGGFADPEESTKTRWSRRTVLMVVGSMVGFLVWDIDRKEWSDRHTWSTAIAQYAVFKLMGILGRWRLRTLLAEAENGEAVQRRLLSELLARHQHTRYAQVHGIANGGEMTFEEFRKVHPVTKHADYSEYITQVCEGEDNVLATGRPTVLAMTPGISGPPSLVPQNADISRNFFLRGICVVFGVVETEFPSAVHNLQRCATLAVGDFHQRLPCGLKTATTTTLQADQGLQKLTCVHTSPLAAYQIRLDPDRLYAHAVFALKDSNLGVIDARFTPSLCSLMDAIYENRRSLVQDIRNGHVWDRRRIDGHENLLTREALDSEIGGPDPKRALQVDKLLRENAPAEKLWPNLRLVMAMDGGAFAPSTVRLRQLLGESVEIYSPFYATAEGLLGVNITPKRPFGTSTYLLDPGSMVFELLPAKWRHVAEPPPSAPVLPWEAEIGEAYEIVVTTRGGFCRCRLGDLVRVCGRVGQMPVVAVEEPAKHMSPSQC